MHKNAVRNNCPPALRAARLLAIVLVLSACRLFSLQSSQPAPAPVSPTAATLAAPIPSATLPAALPTAAPPTQPQPSLPPTAVPLQPAIPPTAAPLRPTQPAPAPTHPATLRLKMFMIALDDNGQSGKMIGCGDSLIPVNIDVPYTQGVLRAALERLLAQKSQYYGESGLYNALYQSDLRVEGLEIEAGEAIVQLSGRVTLGGECDTPRLIAQLEQTALQFSTVQRVTVTLNGKPIREALSLR